MRESLLALILSEGGFLESVRRDFVRPRLDLERLANWLRENFVRNPGVADLAGETGLSPSRFRTLFRTEQGQSAGRFVQTVRETEARRLLSETRCSVKEIAEALGYSDPIAFHHAFKTRTGTTPARYRRVHGING
jgi:AraC-like DNA-binding protein